VRVADSFDNKESFPVYTEDIEPTRKARNIRERPMIVSFGFAGMFAALELIDHGIKPLIFERGKKIEERSIDVQKLIKDKGVKP
jgi:uncharacterized protein